MDELFLLIINSSELVAFRNLTKCRSIFGIFKECFEMPVVMQDVYFLNACVFIYCLIYGFTTIMEGLVDYFGEKRIVKITDRFNKVESHPTRPGWAIVQTIYSYKVPGFKALAIETQPIKMKPVQLPLYIQRYTELLDFALLAIHTFFLLANLLDTLYHSIWTYYLIVYFIFLNTILRVFAEAIAISHSLFAVHIYFLFLLPKSVWKMSEHEAVELARGITDSVMVIEFLWLCLLGLISIVYSGFPHDIFNCYVCIHVFFYSLTLMGAITRYLPGAVAFNKFSFNTQQHIFQFWMMLLIKTALLTVVVSGARYGFRVPALLAAWMLADTFIVPIVSKLGQMWFKTAIIARESKSKGTAELVGNQPIMV